MNRFKDLFKEFGVRNETELSDLLVKESYTLPCQGGCNREIPIENIVFVNGEPWCRNCLEDNGEKEISEDSWDM
jgi:hypothetical protein